MTTPTLQRILDDIDRLPMMSTALVRLHAVVLDERSSAADAEEAIKPDAALTANLLRTANSPFFGVPRRITSIRSAITLLGMKRAYEAAVSITFVRLIPKRIPGYEVEARSFWHHSAAVAVLSQRLAEQLGSGTNELLFTAGLLHDVGKLVIGSYLVEQAAEVRDRIGRGLATLIGTEQSLLGTTHAVVGAGLARRWNLPEAMEWAARWHHAPSEAPPEVDQRLVDLVHVANVLAHLLGFGADAGELARPLDRGAVARLGTRVQKLEQVASSAMDEVAQFGEVFSDTGGTA